MLSVPLRTSPTILSGVHVLQRLQQLPGFILGAGIDLRRQIAIGHLAGKLHGRAQGAHDAHRQDPGAHDAKSQCQRSQHQHQVAAGIGDGVDLARRRVDAGALVFQQVQHHLLVFRGGRYEGLFEHFIGGIDLRFALQLVDLVTRADIHLALFQQAREHGFFRRLVDQRLDLLLQFGRAGRRDFRFFGEIATERGIAAAGDGDGAAHGTVDTAIPVGNVTFLGQRLLHHDARGAGHVVQAPDADARNEHGKQQNHGKTESKADTDADVA